MNEGASLRHRIGGRWAISWWAFIALTLLSAAGIAQMASSAREGARPGDVLLIACVGAMAMGVVLIVADLTAFRDRASHPVPAWWLVALGAAVGIARAATTIGVADAGGLSGSFPAPVLFPTSLMLSVIVVVGVAALLAEAEDYGRRRDALLRNLVEIRALDEARAELGDEVRDALLRELDDATRGIRDQLAAEPVTERERIDFARGLANAVDRDLRPLSRRLNAAEVSPLPVLSTAKALASLGRMFRVYPVQSALIAVPAGAIFLMPRVGPGEAGIRIALVVVIIYLVLSLVRWATNRRPALERWQLVIGIAASTGAVIVNSVVLHALIRTTASWFTVIAILLGVPAMILFASALMWFRERWTGTLSELEYSIDAAQLDAIARNRELARVSRELAQYVHGTLQSHLLATAFAVENAWRAGDPATTAIEAARRAFVMPARDVADRRPALPDALAEQAAVWEGFVDLTTDLDDALVAVPGAQAMRIARIVEEGVSNARKHGRARHVDVRVEPAPGPSARITVTDDGIGPVPGAAGMGSAFLDEAAPGAWSLGPNSDGPGAVLTVTIALGHSVPSRISAETG